MREVPRTSRSDGDTTYIADNVNWWIGQTDKGVLAADTPSSTGNLAEALEKTDTNPTNFLVILS